MLAAFSLRCKFFYNKKIVFFCVSTGDLLVGAEKRFKQTVSTSARTSNLPGRPTCTNVFEVLSNNEYLDISEQTLRDAASVAMTISNFPLLSYVNEPISHLASPTIRPLVQLLADTFQESCSVPHNISEAYYNSSHYVSSSSSLTQLSLSNPIPLEMLVPNDGDGIVELLAQPTQPGALQNAIYHRLHGIDAPELYCVSFINANEKILTRRNGHLSHLAVHYYLQQFARPRGTAVICKENPRFGDVPVDRYHRPLSVFWILWYQRPSRDELSVLDEILASLEGEADAVRSRMTSNFHPTEAATNKPFFLNLNALLVLSGFCHVYTK